MVKFASNAVFPQTAGPGDGVNLNINVHREIAAKIVRDIREHLRSFGVYRASVCVPCFTLHGVAKPSHGSPRDCPSVPLEGRLQDRCHEFLVLPKGTTCFGCLLPTASFESVPFARQTNAGPQTRKFPGADYHSIKECKLPPIIRPTLYVFWKYAKDDLKSFVRENFQVKGDLWASWDSYMAWLTEKRAGTFNFLYLYWWVLVYHGLV